jgi:transcriptional regulator with GAF, ATPase, and Fis domain
LTSYPWPGNIRELQNVIERAVVLSKGESLELASDFSPLAESAILPAAKITSVVLEHPASITREDKVGSLVEVERRHIESVLTQTNWMIEGERGAAKILNLSPSTLRSRMQKLGIRRPSASV